MGYERIMADAVDRERFEKQLAAFLPERLFDAHIHIWEKRHRVAGSYPQRGEDWAEKIEQENPVEALKRDFAQMFPGKQVDGLVFGWVGADIDVCANNAYVGQVVKNNPGWHGLAVTCPSWSREKTIEEIEQNGLDGMKPYITFADPKIPTQEITIFDILTPEQWKLADERRYVCTLHLPRPGRLPDAKNIEQLLRIEREFPGAQVIVAHIGRCYRVEDLGDAMRLLKDTKNMCFDFSGNTNALVIRKALESFGSKRILYGSDLPLTHIHLKRIYEGGHYVNLIRSQERPQINNAAYMRPMSDADTYTFYLYESLSAFGQAAQELGLSQQDVEDVMCNNAKRLLSRAR